MSRFHFDFRDGQTLVRDVEGAEFPTLELAYEEAFKAAREMWRDRLQRRADPRSCAFEITDGDGRLLTVVPFSEILESCRGTHRDKRVFVEAATAMHRTRRLSDEFVATLERMQATVSRSRELVARALRS